MQIVLMSADFAVVCWPMAECRRPISFSNSMDDENENSLRLTVLGFRPACVGDAGQTELA